LETNPRRAGQVGCTGREDVPGKALGWPQERSAELVQTGPGVRDLLAGQGKAKGHW